MWLMEEELPESRTLRSFPPLSSSQSSSQSQKSHIHLECRPSRLLSGLFVLCGQETLEKAVSCCICHRGFCAASCSERILCRLLGEDIRIREPRCTQAPPSVTRKASMTRCHLSESGGFYEGWPKHVRSENLSSLYPWLSTGWLVGGARPLMARNV